MVLAKQSGSRVLDTLRVDALRAEVGSTRCTKSHFHQNCGLVARGMNSSQIALRQLIYSEDMDPALSSSRHTLISSSVDKDGRKEQIAPKSPSSSLLSRLLCGCLDSSQTDNFDDSSHSQTRSRASSFKAAGMSSSSSAAAAVAAAAAAQEEARRDRAGREDFLEKRRQRGSIMYSKSEVHSLGPCLSRCGSCYSVLNRFVSGIRLRCFHPYCRHWPSQNPA